MLKGSSKLLICGGYSPSVTDTCEVINLSSSASTCKNPQNFPTTVHAAIGGLGFKENLILCGGLQNGTHSLENNEWVSLASLSSERAYAEAALLQDGKLLVTGGYGGSGSYLKSVEMLTEEGWKSNTPSLPVTIYRHCMVTVNSTTVMVNGGFQNNQDYSGKTFYFTFGEESWTEGPELKNKRSGHSCGKIKRNRESQEMSIIVAGGYDSSYLSSVEILDRGSNEWLTGPELPVGISVSQMVEDQNGGVVLIGGEPSSFVNLDTLYQLPHGGKEAVWTKMEQKLKIARNQHTAFLVPDNIVDCS